MRQALGGDAGAHTEAHKEAEFRTYTAEEAAQAIEMCNPLSIAYSRESKCWGIAISSGGFLQVTPTQLTACGTGRSAAQLVPAQVSASHVKAILQAQWLLTCTSRVKQL